MTMITKSGKGADVQLFHLQGDVEGCNGYDVCLLAAVDMTVQMTSRVRDTSVSCTPRNM